MDNAGSTVLFEQQAGIATITFNRPDRRNGLTEPMCTRAYEAVSEAAASDARVVILRGAGNDFCVGADIGGSEAERAEPAPPGEIPEFYHAATLLHEMSQVTIAAIDGGCAGAGLGYAAACDLRFGSHEARFATAFLNVGVSGDMGLPWSLNRIVGPAKMRELMLFPGKFDAEAALSMGLVSSLFARNVLHDEVLAIARELASRDPAALKLIKQNCLSAEHLPMREYIEAESTRHLESVSGPNLAERMAQGLDRAKGN